jgi:hypothetical protein
MNTEYMAIYVTVEDIPSTLNTSKLHNTQLTTQSNFLKCVLEGLQKEESDSK